MKRLLLAIIMINILLGLQAFPIKSFDYRLPDKQISAFAASMGGLNLTNILDLNMAYQNPALLGLNEKSGASISYRIPYDQDASFVQLLKTSNLLRSKQFVNATIVTKTAAISYQPWAEIHESTLNGQDSTRQYHDYNLTCVQISAGSKSERNQNFAMGLSAKYLTGRLVYIEEQLHESQYQRTDFIDSGVRGFSMDFAAYYKTDNFRYGIAAYDLISHLYWDGYKDHSLQPRAAAGIDFTSNSYLVAIGADGKLDKEPSLLYHVGAQKDSFLNIESLALRVGAYSEDFKTDDSTHFTFGLGYMWKLLNIDVSMDNLGLTIKNSDYLLSVSTGF